MAAGAWLMTLAFALLWCSRRITKGLPRRRLWRMPDRVAHNVSMSAMALGIGVAMYALFGGMNH